MAKLVGPIIDEMANALQLAAPETAVVTDPRNAAPPCYLLLPRQIVPRTFGNEGGVQLEVSVQAIAPGIGHGDALGWLDGALATLWESIGRAEAQLVAYDSPQTGAALLAYECVYRRHYDTKNL